MSGTDPKGATKGAKESGPITPPIVKGNPSTRKMSKQSPIPSEFIDRLSNAEPGRKWDERDVLDLVEFMVKKHDMYVNQEDLAVLFASHYLREHDRRKCESWDPVLATSLFEELFKRFGDDSYNRNDLYKLSLLISQSNNVMARVKKFLHSKFEWEDPGIKAGLLENMPITFNPKLQAEWLASPDYYGVNLEDMDEGEIEDLYLEKVGLGDIPKENMFEIKGDEFLWQENSDRHLNGETLEKLYGSDIRLVLVVPGPAGGKTYAAAEALHWCKTKNKKLLYLNPLCNGVAAFQKHIRDCEKRHDTHYDLKHYKDDLCYVKNKRVITMPYSKDHNFIASTLSSIGRNDDFEPDLVMYDEPNTGNAFWKNRLFARAPGISATDQHYEAFEKFETVRENAKLVFVMEGQPDVRMMKQCFFNYKPHEIAVFYTRSQPLERYAPSLRIMLPCKGMREAWDAVINARLEAGEKIALPVSSKRVAKRKSDEFKLKGIPQTVLHGDLSTTEKRVTDLEARFKEDKATIFTQVLENSGDYSIQPPKHMQTPEECLEWQKQHEKEHPNEIYTGIFSFAFPGCQNAGNNVQQNNRPRFPGIIPDKTNKPFEFSHQYYLFLASKSGLMDSICSQSEIEWILYDKELNRRRGMSKSQLLKRIQVVAKENKELNHILKLEEGCDRANSRNYLSLLLAHYKADGIQDIKVLKSPPKHLSKLEIEVPPRIFKQIVFFI